MSLAAFVDCVFLSPANVRTVFSFGFLTDEQADLIFEKTGVKVLGFERVVDNFGVRHTIKKHGNAKNEALRGQIAVEKTDFDVLSLVIEQPDRIFLDGPNKMGNDLLIYEKALGSARFVYAEEVRRGRQQLVLQTFFKQKIRSARKN